MIALRNLARTDHMKGEMIVSAAPTVVLDVDEATVRKLRRRAARNGPPVDEEMCHILIGAVRDDDRRKPRIATRLADIGAKRGRLRSATPAKPR
jgi:plasmid stability protein